MVLNTKQLILLTFTLMKLHETHNQRILLSPLNWGMGHVSRCIGLIRQLLAQQNTIIIACDADQQKVFESYFTTVSFIPHAGYPFDFAGKGNFATDLFNNRRKLFPRFAKEQKEVQQMIVEHQIDLVISDQRYGFFSPKTPSIFVTHQLHLPLKWYQFAANWINTKLIRNFSAVWCMDTENNALAGNLSRAIPKIPIDYIGFFSRFEANVSTEEKYKFLFVISGPEPYAEQFFNQVLDFSKTRSEAMACLIPKEYPLQALPPENLQLVTASSWKENDMLFHQSQTLVSRAGYSTLMDLQVLGQKAILIPTPGQSEQLYLEQLHESNPNWKFQTDIKEIT